jgi:hypothetical protein
MKFLSSPFHYIPCLEFPCVSLHLLPLSCHAKPYLSLHCIEFLTFPCHSFTFHAIP